MIDSPWTLDATRRRQAEARTWVRDRHQAIRCARLTAAVPAQVAVAGVALAGLGDSALRAADALGDFVAEVELARLWADA